MNLLKHKHYLLFFIPAFSICLVCCSINKTEKPIISNKYDSYINEVKLLSNDSVALWKELEKLNDKEDIGKKAVVLFTIGSYYSNNSNFDNAIQYLKKGITTAEKANNLHLICEGLNQLATCYRRISDIENASLNYSRILDIVGDESNKDIITREYYLGTLNGIGMLAYEQKLYNKALDYYKHSIQVCDTSNYYNYAVAGHCINKVYRETGKTDSAQFYARFSIRNNQKLGSDLGLAIAYTDLTDIFRIKGEYNKAISTSDTAIYYAQKAQNPYYEGRSYIVAGYNLAEINRIESAKNYILKGYQLANKLNDLERMNQAEKLMVGIYEKQGKSDSSYIWLKRALSSQELLSIRETDKIVDLQVQYKTQSNNLEIERLKVNNLKTVQTRNHLIALFAIALMLLLILIFIYRNKQLNEKLKHNKLKQKLLLSQMNPHFMYNALYSIQNYILKNDPIKTYDYISDFAIVSRSQLESSRKEFVPLDFELEMLNSYLRLQQLRFNNRFEFNIINKLDDNKNEYLIPSMILQPFVENAIEHGVRLLNERKGIISIHYSKNDENILIKISDNGVGLKNSIVNTHTGFDSVSTEIIRERIQVLKKSYHINIGLNISNNEKGNGVLVTLTIPMHLKKIVAKK
ncbi:MAG: histidine kinase [Prolixibacteraceae bacterium]|nr:histidine kinase [Prolixibacteraceae bacterium]MBN2648911.1 histidine kinase [Prolixibacteraceae bacterium]